MKSILVTGGAGFIGSHLCEKLLKDRTVKKVVVVDNLDPTYEPKYKKENLAILSSNKKLVFYKTDIRNKPALKKIFAKEKPVHVVHLAAKTDTRTSVNEPHDYESVNLGGTLNLLELSKDFGVKKFVFFSSSSVYGNDLKPPFKEGDKTDSPLSPYAATKKSGELLAHTYFYNHGMDIACFRIFNAYGPRLRPSLVLYKWVESILKGETIEMSGTGTRKRDFTHVNDIVGAVELALEKVQGFEVFNIGSSRPASLVELLHTVEKVTGMKADIKSRPSSRASVEFTYANINKANKLLGWEPQVTLEKGVLDFTDWFRNNRLKKTR